MSQRKRYRQSTLDEYARCHQAATEWMNDHYQDHITLDDFCSQMYYVKRSVQRAFAFYGTSWRTELTFIRMENAAQLLLRTDRPVGEIANKVGYRQPHQFAKAFAREYGFAPLAYRQANRKVAA